MRWSTFVALSVAAFALACSPAPEDPGVPDGGDDDGGGQQDGGEEPACVLGFSHPVGFPCNRTADCAEGFCFEDLFDSFCTVGCQPGGAAVCPEGFECAPGDGAEAAHVCRPADGGLPLPGDRTLEPGSPCNHHEDCEGEYTTCESVPLGDGRYHRYCSQPCEDPSICGECGTCLPSLTGELRCVPRGSGFIGDACEVPHDCASFDCRGFCTAACDPSEAAPCEDQGRCVAAGSEHLCVSPDQIGGLREGDACAYSFQCPEDFRCRDAGSGRVCVAAKAEGERCASTEECADELRCRPAVAGAPLTCEAAGVPGDACRPASNADCAAAFDCRRLSSVDDVCSDSCTADGDCSNGSRCVAIDLDTEIHLFDHDGGNPRATSPGSVARGTDIDRIRGNEWSEIRSFEISPETFPRRPLPASFHVSVHSPGGSVGRYRLEVAVEGIDSAIVVESEAPGGFTNNSGATAQPIPLPAIVKGFLSPNDVDFFVFEVTGPVVVTLRTSRGAPSACLPDTYAGVVPVTGRCTNNVVCESGICEGQLQACVEPCADPEDAPEPEGEGEGDDEQEPEEPFERCVFPLICAALPDGEFCVTPEYPGKPLGTPCAYDYECDSERCLFFGGQRVCSARCDDGVSCPTSMECLAGDCVPSGNRSGAFHAECVRQSDCQPGLQCENGRCTTPCADDSACPAQQFPISSEIACQPCLTHNDCGVSGTCVRRGSEAFCALPCAGGCGEGFRCSVFDGSVCVPEHGSCRRPICAPAEEEDSFCRVPSGGFAELCRDDVDCTTGRCEGGLCSRTCSVPEDCACESGDLTCEANLCVPSPSLTREVEPNDREAQAQDVGELPAKVLADLRPVDGAPDRDFYAITLAQGDRVTVRTRPVCGTGAPGLETRVTLWFRGSVLARSDFRDRYGRVTQTVFDAGEYIIEVRDDTFGAPQTGAYVLEVER